jgi:hypothetical protein
LLKETAPNSLLEEMPAGSLLVKTRSPPLPAIILAPAKAVIPAPALMSTVVAPLKVVESEPPDGLAASHSTLPVSTPEQAARASEPWPIAINETAASSTPRHAPTLQPFVVTTPTPTPLSQAGKITTIWRIADVNSSCLQQRIRNVFSPSAWIPGPPDLPAVVAIQHQRFLR